MKKISAILVLVILAVASSAGAATSNGTLTVTADVESSISFTIESAAGNSVSGTGTSAVTSALGSIRKYGGTVPTGFTRTQGASDWTLSATSGVGVKVEKANLTSSNYTLTAQLGSAPASGVTWKLNSSTLSNSTPTTLTSTGAYSSTLTYQWDIVITDALAAGAINNSISFTATSN